ncbi:MAG: glycosyltransferase family 2 protein [Novosphingobium sp.]
MTDSSKLANSGHAASTIGEQSGPAPVCVIIAAWNASATIARAVRSALAQAETAEVVVVDDASSDGTEAAARAADDGSGRLQVIRLEANGGPSAARNRAIAASRAPFVAILDADDYLLPGRFKPMLAQNGWDVIADNIVFIREGLAANFDPASVGDFAPRPEAISLAQFIAGNMARSDNHRGELGFAKPLIRRAFLDLHGLGYDESLRLGEDYALYAQALAKGARFLRIRSCGYVAIERDGSLSGHHGTADLAALLAFDRKFAMTPDLPPDAQASLRTHAAQMEHKLHYRQMLDIRQARGRGQAVLAAMQRPAQLPRMVLAFLRDKLHLGSPALPAADHRYLFD